MDFFLALHYSGEHYPLAWNQHMTRENFDKLFSLITYHLDGDHKWRVPLCDLKEALATLRIPSDTQENNHGT
jgi:hypothetical protein